MAPLAWDWFEEKLEDELNESSHEEIVNVLMKLDLDKELFDLFGEISDEEQSRRVVVLFKLTKNALIYQHKLSKRSQRKKSIRRKNSTKSKTHSTTSEDEVDELNVERLKDKLEDNEQELSVERQTNKKLKAQIEILKKEKRELQSDLNHLQRQHATEEEPPWQQRQSGEKIQELTQELEDCKLHIKQLLDDCHSLEEENTAYQSCIKSLEENMAAEVKRLEEAVEEYSVLKRTSVMADEMLQSLRQENAVLKSRLDEVQELRLQHDQDLEYIAQAVDLSLEKCKEIIVSKDIEIGDLRTKLAVIEGQGIYTALDTEKETVIKLQQIIKEREEQLEHLSRQLKDATDEMESSTATIQELKSVLANVEDDGGQKVILAQRHQLVESETTVADLTTKLAAMDEEMSDRERELNEALQRMRQYEAGEYGLAEATAELRTVRKQLNIIQVQNEQLNQQCNCLEMDLSELQTENEELRAKLGLSPSHKLSTESTSKLSSLRFENHKLLSELKKLNDDVLNYRLENQSLKREIRKKSSPLESPPKISTENLVEKVQHSVATQIAPESQKTQEIEIHPKLLEDFEKVCAENLVLRRGLAEILDAVREHDGSSDVKLESPTLEKLLTVLNAERQWGHYDPSLDLQCQLEKIQGQNSLLRENLRELRRERRELKKQLTDAIKATAFQQKVLMERSTSPKEEVLVAANVPASQNSGICQLDLIDSTLKCQESKATYLELEVARVKTQLSAFEERVESEKMKFQTEISIMERNLASKVTQIKMVEERNQELEFQLRQAQKCADEKEQLLVQHRNELPQAVRRSSDAPDSFETSEAKELLHRAILVLRGRLQEKEQVVDRYQSLLEESRREQCQLIEDHKGEILRLQDTIYNHQRALSKAERLHRDLAAAEAANRAAMSQLELQSSQATVLEEEIQGLQREKENWQIQCQEWQHKYHQSARELKFVKESLEKERDMMCQKLVKELEAAQKEIRTLRKGYDQVTQNLTAESFEQQRAKLLNALVQKLKTELTNKEQQMKALQTVVEQMKNDFDSRKFEPSAPIIQEDEVTNLQTKIYDLEKKAANMQSKLAEKEESVKTLTSQVENLRAEIESKESGFNKLHADKASISKQLVVLRTRVTQLTAERVAREVNAGDAVRLSHRVKELEAQLAMFHKAEKPHEGGTEFERWKEKKRLQLQIDTLKKKLKDSEDSVEEQKDKIWNLRSLVQRIEADKRVLEDRVKVKSEKEKKVNYLEEENARLRARITALEAEYDDLKEEQTSTDRHRLQIKVLEDRIRKQEKKIAELELNPVRNAFVSKVRGSKL